MTSPKMAPMFRPPELLYLPAEYPVVFQWHRYGEYVAGFTTEAKAQEYGRLKGWVK